MLINWPFDPNIYTNWSFAFPDYNKRMAAIKAATLYYFDAI